MIKSRRLTWAGHVAGMEESSSAFKILTGTGTGKRPLGRLDRPTRNWVDSAQDRHYWRAVVNVALNLQVP